MNHTTNYQLSQWAKSDQVKMEDFNADNAKIDAALKAEEDARTALAAQVALRGNCKIWTTTYTGTGTYGQNAPSSLTFPAPPLFAIITGPRGALMLLVPNEGLALHHSSNNGHGENNVSWSGATVTWAASIYPSAAVQMNMSGSKYIVVAFYLSDQP